MGEPETTRAPVPQFCHFLPQMRMDLDALVARARAAEAAGFYGIALMDHLAPPLAEAQPMWEAMTAASWLLAHTERLVVGHLVLCDAFRHPAVLARQAVTLDHASKGRFELGIGSGSVPAEFSTFGVGAGDSAARVARLGETLDIVRALWRGEPVDYDGDSFTLAGAQQRPVPLRTIPIVVGGVGPRTLELVRQHADWWNLPMHTTERLDELRPRAGGARVSVQEMVAPVADESRRSEVTETIQRRYGGTAMAARVVIGRPDELVGHFAALCDRGVERFYVWFTDFAPPETLAAFGAHVIAPLSGSSR